MQNPIAALTIASPKTKEGRCFTHDQCTKYITVFFKLVLLVHFVYSIADFLLSIITRYKVLCHSDQK